MNTTIISAITYSILILLISSLIVTLSPSIHAKELNSEQAIEIDRVFVNYFQTGESLEIANIKGITEPEIRHLFDVKKLLIIISIITVILGLTLLLLWDNNKSILGTMLSPLLMLWVSAPTFLIMNFDKLFKTFHELLFWKGNYIFPMDSILISTYPAEFFKSMGLKIITIYFFITIGFLASKLISDKIYSLNYNFKNRE